eukprot:7946938-Pyramimonas_sp.AAC.3
MQCIRRHIRDVGLVVAPPPGHGKLMVFLLCRRQFVIQRPPAAAAASSWGRTSVLLRAWSSLTPRTPRRSSRGRRAVDGSRVARRGFE